jgi:hypothetical protein
LGIALFILFYLNRAMAMNPNDSRSSSSEKSKYSSSSSGEVKPESLRINNESLDGGSFSSDQASESYVPLRSMPVYAGRTHYGALEKVPQTPEKDILRLYWNQCIPESFQELRDLGDKALTRQMDTPDVASFLRKLLSYLLQGRKKIIMCDTCIAPNEPGFFSILSHAIRSFYPDRDLCLINERTIKYFSKNFGLCRRFDPNKDYLVLDQIIFYLTRHFVTSENPI